MKKEELLAAVEEAKTTTRDALQVVYDSLNHGQQKQIIKNDAVKGLFDLYKVKYTNEVIE